MPPLKDNDKLLDLFIEFKDDFSDYKADVKVIAVKLARLEKIVYGVVMAVLIGVATMHFGG